MNDTTSTSTDWRCPLCWGARSAILDMVRVKDVLREYRLQLGVRLTDPGFSLVTLLECAQCGLMTYWPQWIGSQALYDQLGQHEWYYRGEKHGYRNAARWIDPAASVLEIGAGTGLFAERLALTNYEGLEPNESAARIAREAGRNVHSMEIREYATRHPSARDCVCLFQVLEHVADVCGMLEVCVAALQPGGGLIISVPNNEGFMGVEKSNALNLPPHHATRWTRRAVEYIGKSLDLKVLEVAEEDLADDHVTSYARCLGSSLLEKRLGLKLRSLHPLVTSPLWRGMAALLGSETAAALRREPRLRPRGHSIVGVFGKQ